MVDTDYSKLTDIQAKRKLILDVFNNILLDFFYYDRKNSEDLNYKELKDALTNKIIEVEDFKLVIDKFFKEDL